MPNARIVDAADAVATLLSALSPGTITRGNVPEQELEDMSGAYLWVFDYQEREGERVTRSEIIQEYEISVVFLNRYSTQTAANTDEPVPTSWVDEQKYAVEQKVFNVLTLNSNRLLSSALYPWTVRYEPDGVPFDPNVLADHKVFRSEVRVVYRELKSG